MEIKQGCLMFLTLFGIYIDKLEACLEEASCNGYTLVGIVTIFILYEDDFVLMVRCPFLSQQETKNS
jgi:hypothetical protein